jgi:hypothetical protein
VSQASRERERERRFIDHCNRYYQWPDLPRIPWGTAPFVDLFPGWRAEQERRYVAWVAQVPDEERAQEPLVLELALRRRTEIPPPDVLIDL